MPELKKITISRVGDFYLYYFDTEDKKRFYNFGDQHGIFMMGCESLSSAVVQYLDKVVQHTFYAEGKKKNYKNWKAMLDHHAQIYRRINKLIYKDLKTSLDLI